MLRMSKPNTCKIKFNRLCFHCHRKSSCRILCDMIRSLKKAAPSFVISLLVLLIFPSFAPQIRLLAFVPFLTFVIANNRLPGALWLSLIAGLVVDLYSNIAPLGFFALNYTLTSVVVYRYRSYFSQEKAHIFSLYSLLYSLISTALHFVLYALIEMHIKLHLFSIITDLILMPILDGVYALVLVFFPLKVYAQITQPKMVKKIKLAFALFKSKLVRHIYKLRPAR